MEVYEVKKLDGDIYRIRVRLINKNAMPSVSYQTVKNKLYPLDQLSIKGSGIKIISGGKITNIYQDKTEYKEFKPEIQFCQVPGFGKVEYQFLVSGKGSLEINYKSVKAGSRKTEIPLK